MSNAPLLKNLLQEIRQCRICAAHLPHGPRPVLDASPSSKILIIGQAPGRIVHETGIPWDDQSGKNLRRWMGISPAVFYDASQVAILPMGFCFPGTGKSGDLPPRKECAPAWHQAVLDQLPELELTLLVGQYAQKYYLGQRARKNLTQTVQAFEEYLPNFFPLPHPSPRNNIWQAKNPWFEAQVLALLQERVQEVLGI